MPNQEKQLAIVAPEITEDKYPELFVKGGLDIFLDAAKEKASEVVDITTKEGRARVKTLAANVSSSKTAVTKPGRLYLKEIKARPKIIEVELRKFETAMDTLRDATRSPLTEWEAEQERIKEAEAAAIKAEEDRKAAEALAKQIEECHEFGLLMNEKIDRVKAEEAEAERIAAEEKAEAARLEAVRIAQEEADRVAAEAKVVPEVEKTISQDEIDSLHEVALLTNNRLIRERAASNPSPEPVQQQEPVMQAAPAPRVSHRPVARTQSKSVTNTGLLLGAIKESLMEWAQIDDETARRVTLAIHRNQVVNVSITMDES